MKLLYRIIPLALAALLLSGCGASSRGEAAAESEHAAASVSITSTEDGRALLERAFACDLSDAEETKEEMSDRLSLRFTLAEDDMYLVEYGSDQAYPVTLYHLNHFGQDEGFDLTEESADYFKPELVQTAKDFVQTLYGVNCDNAQISAYGYANKIAVQLNVAENQAFSVRFYYADTQPSGVLFWNQSGAFERAMERDGAQKYPVAEDAAGT